MTVKYAPDSIITLKGRRPVTGYVAYPPNNHPDRSPIARSLTALEIQTDGDSRWFGFDRAWINSELRMCVEGFNPSFEEVSRWEDCSTE